MIQNNQERFKEDMEILWKMVRTNELYTFDMFYNDLKGKILGAIELDVIKMTDILLTQPSIKDYETLPEHTLNSAKAIASAKDKVVRIK